MEIVSLLENVTFGDKQPAVQVLINNDFCKEIRIAFQEGQEMKAHKAPYPIIIEIVKGHIDFGIGDERVQLTAGSLITLDSHVIHDLKATKESIVRLSLHKADQIDRVQQVVTA